MTDQSLTWAAVGFLGGVVAITVFQLLLIYANGVEETPKTTEFFEIDLKENGQLVHTQAIEVDQDKTLMAISIDFDDFPVSRSPKVVTAEVDYEEDH